jgi:hypothetical protein
MTRQVTFGILLVLVQLGVAQAVSAPYALPNLTLAYLIGQAAEVGLPRAGWLGLALGLLEGVALAAPIGSEPIVFALIGMTVSALYRNPLQSRVVVPLAFGVGAVLAYEVLTGLSGWIRWGYPVMSMAVVAKKWPSFLATAAMVVVFKAAVGRAARLA